jgi:hypothetical protein
MIENVRVLGRRFGLQGDFLSHKGYGSGHINDTILVTYQDEDDGSIKRYLHQRINHHVFHDPSLVMSNIEKITEQQRRILLESGHPDVDRMAMQLIRTPEGTTWCKDADGYYWRTYDFIENAMTYDVVDQPELAFEAGRAFGDFQKLLLDIDPSEIHETIPHFHDTPKRLSDLAAAVAADPYNRVRKCRGELALAFSYAWLAPKLLDLNAQGLIPTRVTHNDTKINNVLFDTQSPRAICVIDLDTVMPGLSLYDFGDLMRTATCRAAEDEQDLGLIEVDQDLFKALIQGYLSTTREFLTPAEKENLVLSGMLITYELAVRFLTDYLNGDVYFKVHRERHNLDRARTQFKLVQSMERQREALEGAVFNALGESLG